MITEKSVTVTISDELGLHPRAAAALVRTAVKYPVEIRIGTAEGVMTDAKSIMSLVMLKVPYGTEVDISARGPSEVCAAALSDLEELFLEGFHTRRE